METLIFILLLVLSIPALQAWSKGMDRDIAEVAKEAYKQKNGIGQK